MKKLLFIITIILCLIIYTPVYGATYIQGIVTGSNQVKEEATNSAAAMKNDEGNIMSLSSPEAVEILETSGSFYKIKFLYTGFVYTGYFPTSKMTAVTYETDDEYEKALVDKGFPSDYAKRLAILHAIHPNWTFSPSYTGGMQGGMDFMTAVNGEAAVVARNLISGSNTTLRSTKDGAYANGVWLSLSGSGWYAASEQTIAFYMDPRNFLDESHIFMFENLGYNEETQTEEVINKIISATFMNNPFNCTSLSYNCTLGAHTFLNTFITAGKDKKVSPVHLASRVVQEQGSKGSILSLGNGYNGEYVGYYNFFNIGASGITTQDVILNGFKYAYSRKWNNQFASIYEGSDTISKNYIGRGQSTGYYQKFNTIVPSYYGNQYMQNIRAPYTEGYSTYTAYYRTYQNKDDWNNAVYDFLIPIYTNMPSVTSLDTSNNSDSTLRTLKVSSCNSLTPEFNSNTYSYDCYVPTTTEKVTIEAVTTNHMAKINEIGEVELTENSTEIEIEVTAANGNKSKYTVKVNKMDTDGYTPSEIINGIGLKTNGGYAYNAELGSDIANLANAIKNKYHFAKVELSNAKGDAILEGTIKTGDKVTITNAGTTSTFSIIIFGDVNGDGKITIEDLVPIKKHLIGTNSLKGVYLEASDISRNNSVQIDDLLYLRKNLLGQYSINQG